MNFARNLFVNIWDITKVVVISAAIIIPIRTFVFQPFFVRGTSMEPSFYNGDYLIIDELSYSLREPDRGEVVVFRPPGNDTQFYIKRIIGLPGEKVTIDKSTVSVFTEGNEIVLKEPYIAEDIINGNKQIIAGPGEYVLLGDNRGHSSDSRVFGPVSRKNFVGKVLITAWPIGDFALFAAPVY